MSGHYGRKTNDVHVLNYFSLRTLSFFFNKFENRVFSHITINHVLYQSYSLIVIYYNYAALYALLMTKSPTTIIVRKNLHEIYLDTWEEKTKHMMSSLMN